MVAAGYHAQNRELACLVHVAQNWPRFCENDMHEDKHLKRVA